MASTRSTNDEATYFAVMVVAPGSAALYDGDSTLVSVIVPWIRRSGSLRTAARSDLVLLVGRHLSTENSMGSILTVLPASKNQKALSSLRVASPVLGRETKVVR